MSKKIKPVYTPVKNDDGVELPTFIFPGGGRVVLDDGGGQGEAYDHKGRFLGFSTQKACEKAAETGRVITTPPDTAGDLSVWVFWNDAVAAGASVLEAQNGEQILCINDNVQLLARRDDHGWMVEWLGYEDLEDRYWNSWDECYDLVYAEKPFKLQ